jgi:hypothetical protein
MPTYQTTDQLYACARQLFDRIQRDDPEAARPLLASRLVIRLRITGPTGEIVINGRSRPITTTFGSSSNRPDLEIELSGDTLHQILVGQLAITKALGSKQLKAKGPVWKATVLADLFRQGQTIYPEILREQGIAYT